MDNQKIAIIGLGRIGSAFLRNLLARSGRGVDVVGVAESGDTPGRKLALDAGLKIASLDEIVALGSGIDILFDLTGLPAVRREIREKLMAQDNHHTVVASETIARLIWALTSDDELPVIAGRSTGY
ncbi:MULTISPECIES: homoserine dehydrogenase [unclassified Duganella]|uniref:homoserine dehydrogenase n=1 Tax=unclassified Duganella TaxID=2636909 RepID=UPI0008857DBA|nr:MULTISPECIES: homoserine dehydrogenase [unclassified Duganella]SDG24506.1 Homoserine dehydrogenase, NAD binding domain [Duganella sp. OV458]SDJ23843.1 Homoserine dehydrogenase, NAD binding domain [Duganella sp. OV510]